MANEIILWISLLPLTNFVSELPRRLCGKELPAKQEMWVWSLGREDPLENEMATHSGILAKEIPWTKEPGRLQSMGSQRVRHDLVTKQTKNNFVSGFHYLQHEN